MKQLSEKLRRFLLAEDGLETIEYAVITGLVVVTMIVAITMLSTAISSR